MSEETHKDHNPIQIEIFKGSNDEWGYRFKRSGRILLSGFGYDTLQNVKRALEAFVNGMFPIVTDTYFMKKVKYIEN